MAILRRAFSLQKVKDIDGVLLIWWNRNGLGFIQITEVIKDVEQFLAPLVVCKK